MVNIGENILESSETNFMNLPPYVFDVDYVAKIRFELSITVLEKNTALLPILSVKFQKILYSKVALHNIHILPFVRYATH